MSPLAGFGRRLRRLRLNRLGSSDLALVLAALAVLAGFVVALRPQHTATTTVNPAAAQIARPTVPANDRLTALVIGDAYSSGALTEYYYACMAAARKGWLCKLAAEPGTGYISGGTANRFNLDQGSGKSTSFGERIPALGPVYKPDVVILDGGRYDTFVPPNARFDVTASTIWQVRQTWPNAKIVFIKPRFLAKPGDDLGVTDEVAGLLKAGMPDMIVVDPIARFANIDTKDLIDRNGNDPSRKGAQQLADALADEITKGEAAEAAKTEAAKAETNKSEAAKPDAAKNDQATNDETAKIGAPPAR